MTAYVAYWDLGAVVLDISDPSSITFKGRTVYPLASDGDTHSAVPNADDSLLATTDEDFSPVDLPTKIPGDTWGFARLWDLRSVESRPSERRDDAALADKQDERVLFGTQPRVRRKQAVCQLVLGRGPHLRRLGPDDAARNQFLPRAAEPRDPFPRVQFPWIGASMSKVGASTSAICSLASTSSRRNSETMKPRAPSRRPSARDVQRDATSPTSPRVAARVTGRSRGPV